MADRLRRPGVDDPDEHRDARAGREALRDLVGRRRGKGLDARGALQLDARAQEVRIRGPSAAVGNVVTEAERETVEAVRREEARHDRLLVALEDGASVLVRELRERQVPGCLGTRGARREKAEARGVVVDGRRVVRDAREGAAHRDRPRAHEAVVEGAGDGSVAVNAEGSAQGAEDDGTLGVRSGPSRQWPWS